VKKIFSILPDLAESDAPVLLEGESGTGKELIAATIHTLSKRYRYPLVKVSCSVFSEEALMDELFGCRVNSLHGVREDCIGQMEMARGGTLFLDEIDCLPPRVQVMLFRAFEDGHYMPLGAQRPETLDVRLIAATEKNLKNLVREGKFRESLYYRLNVFYIQLPPLRERRGDIIFLAYQHIRYLNERSEKAVEDFDLDTLRALRRYHYPGNIKELENIIRHAHILAGGKSICLSDLPPRLSEEKKPKGCQRAAKADIKTIEEVERDVILDALRRNDGNRGKAAEELGINRTTLWRKIKRMESWPLCPVSVLHPSTEDAVGTNFKYTQSKEEDF
jgi:DNA-binding NtrC family response regulator